MEKKPSTWICQFVFWSIRQEAPSNHPRWKGGEFWPPQIDSMKKYSMKHIFLAAAAMTGLGISQFSIAAAGDSPAAQSVNALGLELLAKSGEAKANALLSPYSI